MKKSVMLLLLICSQLSAMEESIACAKQATEGWTKQEWLQYVEGMNKRLGEACKRRRIKKEKPAPPTPYSASPYVSDSDD